MEKKVNIQFFIKEISTLEFYIKNLQNTNINANNDVVFEITPSSSIDAKNSAINFVTYIGIFADSNKKNKICQLITSIQYGIKNFEQFIDENDKNLIHLPDQFMQTLLSISLSTSRGILAAKTEGTILRNIYLPVLNPTQFKPTENLIPNVN